MTVSSIVERVRWIAALAIVALAAGCGNNPHPKSEWTAEITYRSFSEIPKTFDPASSYSSDEYEFICQIYEPPLQYHFLRRPGGGYSLVPLTARRVPRPHGNPPMYDIRIRPGIFYQPHPCFARDEHGRPKYFDLTTQDVRGFQQVSDFAPSPDDTRELVAADYAFQIRRMADPTLKKPCPILPILMRYIIGMEQYAAALQQDLAEERARRRAVAGAAYSQEEDERTRPIVLDLMKHSLPGVRVLGRHHLRIRLKEPYPQFKYWLAMPFFAPMPPEAIRFYSQPALIAQDITLTHFPVGTGAFYLDRLEPNRHIILKRNENYWSEPYPNPPPESEQDENDPRDVVDGLYLDAGRPMPFIEKATYVFEPESIPRWQKFLQGYYDSSGIISEAFDQAVRFTERGVEESPQLQERGIRLVTSIAATIFYLGFNMLDDVVGAPPKFNDPQKEAERDLWLERNRKLRLAITIAIDWQRFIQIFRDGRGIESHGPLPPGIFGYKDGPDGINPFVFRWDAERNKAVRRSVEEAKQLLSEAGYPDGIDPATGRPLIIYFDNTWTSPDQAEIFDWFRMQLAQIGIDYRSRATNYTQFQEKMDKGTAQTYFWGWNADYPDPENFLFLLYSGQAKAIHGGENASNYMNPEYDALFRQLETMENTTERLKLIQQAVRLLQHDAPWVWAFHPVDYALAHQWYHNIKPLVMGNNTLKYRRLDAPLRAQLRREWNQPTLWPLYVLAAAAAVLVLWVGVSLHRRRFRVARRLVEFAERTSR